MSTNCSLMSFSCSASHPLHRQWGQPACGGIPLPLTWRGATSWHSVAPVCTACAKRGLPACGGSDSPLPNLAPLGWMLGHCGCWTIVTSLSSFNGPRAPSGNPRVVKILGFNMLLSSGKCHKLEWDIPHSRVFFLKALVLVSTRNFVPYCTVEFHYNWKHLQLSAWLSTGTFL